MLGYMRAGLRSGEQRLGKMTMGLLNRGMINRAMGPSAGAGALGALNKMGDYSLMSAAGGALGGLYGGMSDNDSFLGGAMKGVALGAGGLFSARSAKNMAGYYGVNLGAMAGRGTAKAAGMASRAWGSVSALGTSLRANNPINKIRSNLDK